MREIGGYFELDQFMNQPYYSDMIGLNSGRNALAYLIKAKRINKVHIPNYLCDSVLGVLKRLSITYEQYSIDRNFLPIFNKQLIAGEYLYVVNYFGQIDNAIIKTIKDHFGAMIADNTQAFFQKPVQDVDTIYSLRKYFGLPDGAYLSTNTFCGIKLEEEKSSHRMVHILGRFEGTASSYYEDFRNNDESFKNLSIKRMSRLSQNILGAIDYGKVKERRNQNFAHLHNLLKSTNRLNIRIPEGPFAYPYYVENGIEIRKRLAEEKIYVPTLWPNVLKSMSANSIEYDYTSNILPLPCDQRYGIEEMERIVKEVKRCID